MNLPHDTAEAMLAASACLVEADGYAHFTLWEDHAADSARQKYSTPGVKWEQGSGWMVTIGELDKRPVCITINFDRLNGKWVAFWDACSQVVDHKMIEEWLDKHYHIGGRRPSCDAMNFHNGLAALKEPPQ